MKTLFLVGHTLAHITSPGRFGPGGSALRSLLPARMKGRLAEIYLNSLFARFVRDYDLLWHMVPPFYVFIFINAAWLF